MGFCRNQTLTSGQQQPFMRTEEREIQVLTATSKTNLKRVVAIL